jgi:hypothetical protein
VRPRPHNALFRHRSLVIMLLTLLAISSCVPAPTSSRVGQGASSDTGGSSAGSGVNSYGDPTFSFEGLFIQEGATQTATSLSLALNFSDTFLIRGKELTSYLRTLPESTRMCLVTRFETSSTSGPALVLAAKRRSFTDLVKKTTEFYLQLAPAEKLTNQADCAGVVSSNAFYSLIDLHQSSNSSLSSTAPLLVFSNATPVPVLNFSRFRFTITAANSSTANTCVESSVCGARGFDCCLEGQCAKDGAERPDGSLKPNYSIARSDVLSNPERFVLYPEIYFVCPTRPGSTNSSTQSGSPNPEYEARIRLMEMNHLYQCLNQVEGEFSYCTVKFPNASQKINSPSPVFSPGDLGYFDDINFSQLNNSFTSAPSSYNITKIFYGGETLYEKDLINLNSADGSFENIGNDNLTDAQGVRITRALGATALDDTLYLTYRVDGTCSRISSTLAKCQKTYIHDSDNPSSTFHHDDTLFYKLPDYADVSPEANLIVKVGGVLVTEENGITWRRYRNSNSQGIEFFQQIFKNQQIEITYYVKNNVSNLLKSRQDQQARVNTMCLCPANSACNLRPIYNEQNNLSNFECVYSTTTSSSPPINQRVEVSNKNTPHRYYDINGVAHDDPSGALNQEGLAYSYQNNNLLRPSNLTTYTGFNEIYGSFYKTIVSAAKPAKVVSVKKDKIYDIYTDTGFFSTCPSCGFDYYSTLQKIFPENFTGKGGGYSPDYLASSRQRSTGIYRSDDLLFGRACFVPASMIPWTHNSASSVTLQRRQRLASQHFLFANGYQRDWYGFDYGSLIGSFDGVSWFSIGNARRIKAKSNKLFLAVNAYFGDLNTNSTYSVSVSETVNFSQDIPDHDSETDGAECQRAHFCSNDNDCIRQLGYDYSCQSVSSISTKWPLIDANGTETVGERSTTLLSLIGGSNGQSKRCVYRGRGAPCHPNVTASSISGLTACSPNNMCQPLSGSNSNRFNDRIARFANTPVSQNFDNQSPTPSDTVGLGARLLGRPFDYFGDKSPPSGSTSSLGGNNVTALCVPGKNISLATSTLDLNNLAPSTSQRKTTSDKILGQGTTISPTPSTKYLNACTITNSSGLNLHYSNLSLGQSSLLTPGITQNLSSGLLNLAPLINQGIFSTTGATQALSLGVQSNACLRAPGAACFSDLDCAPSPLISEKTRAANLSSLLNSAEISFWQEEMICGNPEIKYLQLGVANGAFDIRKNSCCRETGRDFTVFTETDSSPHRWCLDTTPGGVNSVPLIAGLNTALTSSSRYSRVHSVYDTFTCNPNELSQRPFALSLDANGNFAQAFQQIQAQYKTLDTLNKRTCCTQNWIRNFHSTNGGGHRWGRDKMQVINKSIFRGFNWAPRKIPDLNNQAAYSCELNAYNLEDCEIRNFSDTDKQKYLTFFSSLELIGIPQVAIMSQDDINMTNTNQDDHSFSSPVGLPPFEPYTSTPKYIVPLLPPMPSMGDAAFISNNKRYFSAASAGNELKSVFSDKDFSCCLPTGAAIADTTTPDQCCTGNISSTGESTVRRCCLPDYTDVTLYLNRYVSSQGSGYPDSAYDPSTGEIKDPGLVETIEASKNICCSGKTARGVAIRKLPIPITGGLWVNQSDAWTTRFTYLDNSIDNNNRFGPIGQLFDAGVRWNNHVYCIPADINIPDEPN